MHKIISHMHTHALLIPKSRMKIYDVGNLQIYKRFIKKQAIRTTSNSLQRVKVCVFLSEHVSLSRSSEGIGTSRSHSPD